MDEIWKDIPEYEGIYQISNLGRVKSLKFGKEKVLKGGLTSDGYPLIHLCKNGNKKAFQVHIIVAIVFLNYKNDNRKIVIDHINNIQTDNRLENLQIITHRENISKSKIGTSIYTGVCWNKRKKKWTASINLNYKRLHLGYFKNEYDAHLAYQNKLLTL